MKYVILDKPPPFGYFLGRGSDPASENPTGACVASANSLTSTPTSYQLYYYTIYLKMEMEMEATAAGSKKTRFTDPLPTMFPKHDTFVIPSNNLLPPRLRPLADNNPTFAEHNRDLLAFIADPMNWKKLSTTPILCHCMECRTILEQDQEWYNYQRSRVTLPLASFFIVDVVHNETAEHYLQVSSLRSLKWYEAAVRFCGDKWNRDANQPPEFAWDPVFANPLPAVGDAGSSLMLTDVSSNSHHHHLSIHLAFLAHMLCNAICCTLS